MPCFGRRIRSVFLFSARRNRIGISHSYEARSFPSSGFAVFGNSNFEDMFGRSLLTGMSKIKIVCLLFFASVAAPSLFAQSVTVNWSSVYQTIDGFGGNCSNIGACDSLTSAQAQTLFDPTNGIGLSIYRDSIPIDGSCSGACAFESSNIVHLAVPYGVKFIASAWAPPASMKSNGSSICNTSSQNSYLLPGSYAAFATYLKNFATQFQSTFGAPLYALSPQNEPNLCSSDPTYGYGASYTGAQLDTFIKNNLGPTLAGTGVKIMMPETSFWPSLNGYADPVMTDSAAASYVSIVAGHDYTLRNCTLYNDCGSIAAYPNAGNARVWETETSMYGGSTVFDPTMTSGIQWANVIHQYLAVANASAWLYWRIYNSHNTNDDEALIQSDGTVSKRFYVLGNWSKYVRPGWVRIGATANPSKGVFITAFKDPVNGGFAIVAVNQNTSSANVDISLSGFPSAASVTPAITSSSLNLSDQASVSISNNSFSYSLPASSVVTFHGTTTVTAQKPAAPTNLTATVH